MGQNYEMEEMEEMKVMKWEGWGWEEVNEKETVKKMQRKREMTEGSRGGGRREGAVEGRKKEMIRWIQA